MAPNQALREIDLIGISGFNVLFYRILNYENLYQFTPQTNFPNSPILGVIFNIKLRLIGFSGFFLAAIAKNYRTLVVSARLKVQIKLWESYAFLKQTNGILAREIHFSNPIS
jgi:hypothetical protein